jgi:hypothetical protein
MHLPAIRALPAFVTLLLTCLAHNYCIHKGLGSIQTTGCKQPFAALGKYTLYLPAPGVQIAAPLA